MIRVKFRSGHQGTSYQSVFEQITDAAKSGKHVFVKDMSQYIVTNKPGNPTVFTDDQLRSFRHSFLVRTPEKSVPSYYRCCSGDAAKETGFETYDPNEAGYKESVTLYNYLSSLSLDPIIIDSSDLINTPKLLMKEYCQQVGISYKEGMIEWKAEKVESFDKWKGFHDDAQASTGFKEVIRNDLDSMPPIVRETIEANRASYEYLFNRRIKIT